MKAIKILGWILLVSLNAAPSFAGELEPGNKAPLFQIKDDQNKTFDLASRKGHWTVLYFYPKAGTPGCTKQACGFRDAIKKIEVLGADVFGISTDTVEDQAKFHKAQHLNFRLLADPDAKVVGMYGTEMAAKNMSKRWTFIIDPDLVIRDIEHDVDPAMDAAKVAKKISELQKNPL
jgi:peroxiredoxin Q/BCP